MSLCLEHGVGLVRRKTLRDNGIRSNGQQVRNEYVGASSQTHVNTSFKPVRQCGNMHTQGMHQLRAPDACEHKFQVCTSLRVRYDSTLQECVSLSRT